MAAEGLTDLPAVEAAGLLQGRLTELFAPTEPLPARTDGYAVYSLFDPDTEVLHVDISLRIPPDPGDVEIRLA